MNKLLLALVTVVFLSASPVGVMAEAQSCSAAKEPILVHINGINTTFAEAKDNAVFLADAKKDRSIPNNVILAYNWSYSQWVPYLGTAVDALDATIQGVLSAVQGGVKYTFALTFKGIFFWDTTGVSQDVSENLQTAIDSIVSAVMALTDIKIGATAKIISDINSQTSSGTPLLLVPHSQGNFYANILYGDLIATHAVKIVSVATPATSTAGNGDYVNSKNDRVVTTIVETARTWNVDIPKTDTDSMGHSFTAVYLDPVLAIGRKAVLDKIETALKSLKPEITGVPITLSWSDSTPITLWVGDNGELHSAIGINGTATYTVCNPQNFTFYFAWASSVGGWPTVATLSAGGKSTTVNLANAFDIMLLAGVTGRLAGSVFVDQSGNIAGVQ